MTSLAQHPEPKARDNRLTDVDAVELTWDDNGNLLDDGVYEYAYDHANRLISASQGEDTHTFCYNGLGDRLGQAINQAGTSYKLDLAGALSQVLIAGSDSYLYGVGRIGEEQVAGWQYHLPDALSSVRQLVDDTSAVTLARSYEPFGDTATIAGTGMTPFQFTGEQSDLIGLLFLRARYLDPATGRLITRDTAELEVTPPCGFHGWIYVRNNPLRFTDPSGVTSIVPLANFAVSDDKAPTWEARERQTIFAAAWNVARAYAFAFNKEMYRTYTSGCGSAFLSAIHPFPGKLSPYSAFLALHGGPITFRRMSEKVEGYWAKTWSSREVRVYANASADDVTLNQRFIVHELGHAFENALLGTLGARMGRENLPAALWDRSLPGEHYGGFAGGFLDWQWSRGEGGYNDGGTPDNPEDDIDGRGEIFADMFIGWVFHQWESSSVPGVWTTTGNLRAAYMEDNMQRWIADAIAVRRGRGFDQ